MATIHSGMHDWDSRDIDNEKHDNTVATMVATNHMESVDSDYQKFREITLGLKKYWENRTPDPGHWSDKLAIYKK